MIMEQFQDPHFWVLLATVIFAVIAVKKGKGPILALLDGRTARIKTELHEAQKLRAEAQDLLAESQKKHRDAIQTAQTIMDNAKESAELMKKDAEKRLTETLARRETQLLDRIARAEASAVQELRTQAADLASRAAEKLLKEAPAKTAATLVDQAIGDLPGRLN